MKINGDLRVLNTVSPSTIYIEMRTIFINAKCPVQLGKAISLQRFGMEKNCTNRDKWYPTIRNLQIILHALTLIALLLLQNFSSLLSVLNRTL